MIRWHNLISISCKMLSMKDYKTSKATWTKSEYSSKVCIEEKCMQVLYYGIVRHGMELYGIVWCSMAKYDIFWQSMAYYGGGLQSMAYNEKIWQSMTLYGKVWWHCMA